MVMSKDFKARLKAQREAGKNEKPNNVVSADAQAAEQQPERQPAPPAAKPNAFASLDNQLAMARHVSNIPVTTVYSVWNIREMDEEKVMDYAATYRSDNPHDMPPIVVWEDQEGKHEVLIGHHRSAAQNHNFNNVSAEDYSTIPAVIRKGERPTDAEIALLQMKENTNRHQMSPYEDAMYVKIQIKNLGLDDSDSKLADVARYTLRDELVGLPDDKAKSKVKTLVSKYSLYMKFLDCEFPDIIQAVKDRKMRIGNNRSGAIQAIEQRRAELQQAEDLQAAAVEEEEAVEAAQAAEQLEQEAALIIEAAEKSEDKTEDELAELAAEAQAKEKEAEEAKKEAEKKAKAAKKKAEKASGKDKSSKPARFSVEYDAMVMLLKLCGHTALEKDLEEVKFDADNLKRGHVDSILKDRLPQIIEELL